MTPDLLNKIAQWRIKAANNTITEAELREAVLLLRDNRRTAAAQPTTRTKSKAPVNADALLDELDSL